MRGFVDLANNSLAGESVSVPDGMLIDVHAQIGHWPFRKLLHNTPEGLLTLMDRFGISKALVSNFECVFYRDVHDGNVDLVERLSGFGERLLVACVVNPAFPGWLEDLRECKVKFHARAIKLYPSYHGYSLKDEVAHECVRECARLGLVVLVVIRVEDERGHHPLLLVPPVPLDDVRAIAESVPEANLVACGAREHEVSRLLKGERELSNLFAEISNVAAPLDSVPALVRALGSERLLFGTNMPFQYPGASTAKLLQPPMEEAARRNIASGNVLRILGNI